MNKILIAAIVVVLAVSCTKEDTNKITVDSPYKFSYDPALSQGEIIAKVDGEEIAVTQLFGPSPSLQELEDRMNKIVLQLIYDKAIAQVEKGEVKITYAFAEPKEDYKKILGKKLNKSIAVHFDESLKGQGAQLGDKLWTREELAGQDMLLSRLMSDSFQQKIKVLEGVISRRKVLQASKEANTPMEDYIQNIIMKGEAEPTDSDVSTFAKNNNIYEQELTPEMKAQVLDAMKARKRDTVIADYVAKNIIKNPVHIGFKKAQLRMDGTEINPEMVPHKGKGPIEIILFSNIQCEACRGLTQTMNSFVGDDSKYFLLQYVFNFPESNNDERMWAEASLCLRKQSPKLFWQFPAFAQKAEGSVEEAINNAVRASGADYEAFRSCFLAREFKSTIDAHLEETKTLGFHKPPVAVVDGVVYEMPEAQDLMDKALSAKAEKGLGFNLLYKLKKMF